MLHLHLGGPTTPVPLIPWALMCLHPRLRQRPQSFCPTRTVFKRIGRGAQSPRAISCVSRGVWRSPSVSAFPLGGVWPVFMVSLMLSPDLLYSAGQISWGMMRPMGLFVSLPSPMPRCVSCGGYSPLLLAHFVVLT